MNKLLSDYSVEELEEIVCGMGESKFRAAQLFLWVSAGAGYSEMSNVPKTLRNNLSKLYDAQGAVIEKSFESVDGTVKFLLKLRDGSLIESVLMKYEYGYTLCVSTQVGCRMGCAFCASGRNGLFRNLSAGEMLSEIICANAFLSGKGSGCRVGNVVLMGSGEPLDNYENVARFIRLLNPSQSIGQRSVSLSTCGLVPGIRRLADDGFSITLCISLHSPFDDKRETIMPVAKSFKIKDVMDAANYYFTKSGRRIIIEYAMMKGVNTSKGDALRLREITKGFSCHVNLIPLNETGASISGVTKKEAYSFMNLVKETGMSVTVRRSLGKDVSGACGQLKRRYLGENDE